MDFFHFVSCRIINQSIDQFIKQQRAKGHLLYKPRQYAIVIVHSVGYNMTVWHRAYCIQTELSRRREQEVAKLKHDLEMVLGERDMSETALRKRHQEAVSELTQQLETAGRNRTKY